MSKPLVIWSHGLQGDPLGAKSTILKEVAEELGWKFEAPDYTGIEDPDMRVAMLLERLKTLKEPAVLAGSSMGGYVSAVAAMTVEARGLFLIAPALYLPGYQYHVFSKMPDHITVVHGWRDDIVPVDNSIRFAKLHEATLLVLESDHRLNDSIDDIVPRFVHLLKST